MLFHLGKTAEKLNQINDAIRFYDGYLLSGPPAKEAAEVRAKLGALERLSLDVSGLGRWDLSSCALQAVANNKAMAVIPAVNVLFILVLFINQ